MLEVLIEQNSDLNKLVKVQEKQISTYQEYVEVYKTQVEDYQELAEQKETIRRKVEQNVKGIVKSYEDEIVMLKNMQEVQQICINALNAKVAELEAYAPSRESSE